MAENRRGGTMFFKVDSVLRDAKGNFTYNLGAPKRNPLHSSDNRTIGYNETPQTPMVEGEITDQGDLVLADFREPDGRTTITIELANGKVVSFRNAWYAGDGNVQTEEGNIQVLFHAHGSRRDERGRHRPRHI